MRARRLFTRIYLHFVGVLLIVGMLSSAGFYGTARLTQHRGPVNRLTARAAALFAARMDDPAALAALGRHLAEDLEVAVTVRAPDGRVLLAEGDALPPLRPWELAQLAAGPRPFSAPFRRGWFMAAPIYRSAAAPSDDAAAVLLFGGVERPPLPGERPVGVLQISLLRPYGGLGVPVMVLATLLLAVALATRPLARRISRPVERLSEANRRLGEGELHYRIPMPPARRGDELWTLQRSWNEMAERIESLVRGHKELLANVSHELRSPLARVRVALALLDEDDDDHEAGQPADAARRARIADITADLGELERLIDDVLTASRLSAQGLPLRRQPVAIAELLEGLMTRAAATPALAGHVRLEPSPPLTLSGDGALLKRALWNLVENAGKYGAPPITLAAARDGDALVLSVSDEGPGIAEGERERVREAFYRGDRARTPAPAPGMGGLGGGFGLGLTLAQRIAEAHGGTLEIAALRGDERGSAPLRPGDAAAPGCRVSLRLPLTP